MHLARRGMSPGLPPLRRGQRADEFAFLAGTRAPRLGPSGARGFSPGPAAQFGNGLPGGL